MEKIRVAAEAGFRAIELWNDELTAHVEAGGTLKEVKAALDDAGLSVPTVIHIGGWLDAEGEAYRQALDVARRKMEQAAAVGAPRIIAGPPAGPVDLDRAAERSRALLAIGREVGALPAMAVLGFGHGIQAIRAAGAHVSRHANP